MLVSEIGEGEQYALFSRRNSSISSIGRLLVFGSLAFVTAAISLGLAVQGAWPIVPFAGLECIALYLVYRWLHAHASDYELIKIAGDEVIVQNRDGGNVGTHTFSRFWVRVVLESGDDGQEHVFLRSHGRQVEIGRLLGSAAKLDAAKRLKSVLAVNSVDRNSALYRGKS